MLCDACKKREAVVHIVKIENGKRTDLHLCAACARKQTSFTNFKDLNIIDNDFFRKMAYPDVPEKGQDEPRCTSCGLTYSEFNRVGKFGCPDCYEAFKEELPPLLRRIHGHSRHTGKVPSRGAAGSYPARGQIKQLQQRLKFLVREERYEEAAKVRDQIRALEGKAPGPGKGE